MSSTVMVNGAEAPEFSSNRSWFNDSESYEDYEADYGGGQFTPSDREEMLQNVVRALHLYYIPTLCVVGMLGNSLSCVILVCGKLAEISASHFLTGKLLADVLFLFTLLHQWLATFNIFFYGIGGWCQFTKFVKYASGFLSLWYMFAFVVDVFIRLYFPRLKVTLCTPWRAKVVTITLAVIAVVVYLNISLMSGVTYAGQRPFCATLVQFTDTVSNLDHADVVINVAVPYMCMLVMVAMVAVRVVKRSTHSPSPGAELELDRQLGIVFLSLCLSYLLLNLPLQGLRVYFMASGTDLTSPHSSTLEDILWHEILRFAHYTAMGLNGFVFAVSFQGFREQSCSWLRTASCRPRENGTRARTNTADAESVTHHFAHNSSSKGGSCIEV